VNSAIYSKDNNNIITGSADGSVRIWDARTTECMMTLHPGSMITEIKLIEIPVRKLIPVPNQPDQTLVLIRQAVTFIMNNLTGQIISIFNAQKKKGSDFVSATFSPQG
jgi:WD40 repeat-containing protein SMU1